VRADPTRWREATLLAAAKVLCGTPESVWSLVDALCFSEPPSLSPSQNKATQTEPAEAERWGALLSGQILWETGLGETTGLEPYHEAKRQRVRLWLQALVEYGRLPPLDQAIAGQALSVLGDGRNLQALAAIPAGEFWMGNDQNDDAKPRHRLKLAVFQIGVYPVANEQYQRFIAATGRVWNFPEVGQPERRNHPATRVSWHHALAYCAWLTRQARASGAITAT